MKKLCILGLTISAIFYVDGAEEAPPQLVEKKRFNTGAVVNSVSFHPDNIRLAAGLKKNKIPIFDTSTEKIVEELDSAAPGVGDLAWSPDGGYLAASGGKAIELINTTNKSSTLIQNAIIPKLPTGVVKYMVNSNPSWNHDGSQLAWGSFQQRGATLVSIWNVAQQRIVHNLRRHKSYVSAVRYHPTDAVLASGSADSNTGGGLRKGTICIWDMRSGQCTQEVRGNGLAKPTSLDWNNNGYLLSSASGTTVHIWDTRNNTCIQQLPGADARAFLTDLSWHPNGHSLASSSRNQTVSLWNTQDGTCLQTFQADTLAIDRHRSHIRGGVPRQPGVFAVDWSQEGQLATGSADGIVRVWEYLQKEDDEDPVPGDDGGSIPGDGEEEEKETRAMLAVADTEGINFFTWQKNRVERTDRHEAQGIRSLSYHPTTKLLKALQDTDGTTYCYTHHPSGNFSSISSRRDNKVCLALYGIKENQDEHLDVFSELSSPCTITYDPEGARLAATSPMEERVTIYILDMILQFIRVGSFSTYGKEPAASAYHPHQKGLITANAGSSTLACFGVDDFGQLHFDRVCPSGGKRPVSLAFDPSGESLLVLHEESNDICRLTPEPTGNLVVTHRYPLLAHYPVNKKLRCKPVALAFEPYDEEEIKSDKEVECRTDMYTAERLFIIKNTARNLAKNPQHDLTQFNKWAKKQSKPALQMLTEYSVYQRNKHERASRDFSAWDTLATLLQSGK